MNKAIFLDRDGTINEDMRDLYQAAGWIVKRNG